MNIVERAYWHSAIADLLTEANEAGDDDQVNLCRLALYAGDQKSWDECVSIISESKGSCN